MKRRTVSTVSLEELQTWPTKRLLGRLNALRKLQESPQVSDADDSECITDGSIRFKSDSRWSEAYRDLKTLLGNRENIRCGKADRLARIKERKR